MAERFRKNSGRDRRTGEPKEWDESLGLLDSFTEILPGSMAPRHLEPLPSLLEATWRGPMRILSSPPVRHGKSTLLEVFIARSLKKRPSTSFFYLGHSAKFVQRFSRATRRMSLAIGTRLADDFNTIEEWRTTEDGGCFWASTDQEVIGRGADVAIFDDALGWNDAHDPAKREEVDEHINFIVSRLNPGGSIIVNGSRCSLDDPMGRRMGRVGWTSVAMPAIQNERCYLGTSCGECGACKSALEAGRFGDDSPETALWPEMRPLENLKAIRTELIESGDESTWRSQFQGEPIADNAGLFKGVQPWLGALPPLGRKIRGVDAAFSVGKRANFFATVLLAEFGDAAIVVDVIRHQRGTHAVLETLQKVREDGVRVVSYVSGPERGVYETMFLLGVEVEMMNARWNKSFRARHCAHAWETKKIYVRMDQPWSRAFVQEINAFTGEEGGVDDQTDALVAAWDALQVGKAFPSFQGGFTFGRPVL
jgi:predicted phage terminase large subunit-like protein